MSNDVRFEKQTHEEDMTSDSNEQRKSSLRVDDVMMGTNGEPLSELLFRSVNSIDTVSRIDDLLFKSNNAADSGLYANLFNTKSSIPSVGNFVSTATATPDIGGNNAPGTIGAGIETGSQIEDVTSKTTSSTGSGLFVNVFDTKIQNDNCTLFVSNSLETANRSGDVAVVGSVVNGNALTPSSIPLNIFSSQAWAPRSLDSNQADFDPTKVFQSTVTSVNNDDIPTSLDTAVSGPIIQPNDNDAFACTIPNNFSKGIFSSQAWAPRTLDPSEANFIPTEVFQSTFVTINKTVNKNHDVSSNQMLPSAISVGGNNSRKKLGGKFDFGAMFESQLAGGDPPPTATTTQLDEKIPSANNSNALMDFLSAMKTSSSATNATNLHSHASTEGENHSLSSVPISEASEQNAVLTLKQLCHSGSSTKKPSHANPKANQQQDQQLRKQQQKEQRIPLPEPRRKRKRKRPNYEPSNKTYVTPTPDDVLLGRGGRANHHSGNQRYLQAKEKFQDRYSKASKDEKTTISQELVDTVHKWGGRFLKLDIDDNSNHSGIQGSTWYQVADIVARKKASQSLREINTPEERAAKRAKYMAKG